MRTILVEDYMTPSPLALAVDERVDEARELMRAKKVRHLPVLDGEALVGVVSDRDLRGLKASLRLSEVMTAAPYSVAPSAPLEVVARHMARRKFGCCVVLEARKVVGVFTTTDALKALAEVLEVAERLPERLGQKAAVVPLAPRRERK